MLVRFNLTITSASPDNSSGVQRSSNRGVQVRRTAEMGLLNCLNMEVTHTACSRGAWHGRLVSRSEGAGGGSGFSLKWQAWGGSVLNGAPVGPPMEASGSEQLNLSLDSKT